MAAWLGFTDHRDDLAAAQAWLDEVYAPRDDRAALLGLALAGLLLTPLCWLCGLLCRVADWGRR